MRRKGPLTNVAKWMNVNCILLKTSWKPCVAWSWRVAHIVCFRHNIGDKGCNYRFNNVFHGVWCVTKFGHHLIHLHLIYNYCSSCEGYWWNPNFITSLNLIVQYNWYVFVMIDHFSQWLDLVPLFDCKNEGESFAFLDMMFSRFGTLTKILIDQGMELCGKFQIMWKNPQ